MRAAPAALKTWLDSGENVSWRGDLYRLQLLDGTIFRWGTAEVPVTVGGFTFLPPGTSAPLVKRGPYSHRRFPEIDTLDLTVTGGDFKINGTDLGLLALEGYFDGARLNVDHLIGRDLPHALSMGPISTFFEGRLAGVDPEWPSMQMRFKSSVEELDTVQLPKFLLQPACGNAVYDATCTLNRATFTDPGTATGGTVTTVTSTTAAIIGRAAAYYELGVLKFTSGALNGVRRAVQAFSVAAGVATFTLAIPLDSAPTNGDAISVYPGCDRKRATCVGRFNNLANFRGFPWIPSPEAGGK